MRVEEEGLSRDQLIRKLMSAAGFSRSDAFAFATNAVLLGRHRVAGVTIEFTPDREVGPPDYGTFTCIRG